MLKSKSLKLFLIFTLALLVRLAYLLCFREQHIGLDGQWYNEVAASLGQGQGVAVNGIPTAYTVPFYPIFLAAIYKVFSFRVEWVFVFQAFIGAINCVLIYIIARILFNEKVGLLSGLLAGFYYFFIKCENMILTEAVFMPLVTLSIFLLIKIKETKKMQYIILCSLSLALATLTRSILFLFPFLLVGLDLLFKLDIFGKRLNFKKLKNTTIFIIIFLLPISFWTYRNYMVFNSFVPLATEGGDALYFSYHPKDGKIFGVAPPDKTSKEIRKNPSEVERNKLFMRAAIKSIKENPLRALKYIGLKNMYFWSIFDWEILGSQGVYNFSTAFMIPFFFVGAVWLLFLKEKGSHIFLLLPIIYIYIMGIIFMGLPRNRYTVEQFMIIIASFCMIKLFEKVKRKKIYICSLFCWFGLNFYLFLNSHITKEWFKLFFEKINLW